jgi:hypothetical protein
MPLLPPPFLSPLENSLTNQRCNVAGVANAGILLIKIMW